MSYRKDYPNQVWFELAETPEKSIALIKKDFKKNNSINLCLKDEKGRPVQPRYAEIYAVLAGDLLWNEGKDSLIYACDLKQNRLRLLKLEDWIHYKWPH